MTASATDIGQKELPAGWRWAKLGDIAEIYQPPNISMNEMDDNGEFAVFGANGIIGRYGKFNHEEPQLLIACRGTCGTVNFSTPRAFITGNAMVVNPARELASKEFLGFYFKGVADFSRIITGSSQPQITRASLLPLSVPLPPLEEQERIVRILNEQMVAVEEAKEAAQQQLEATKALPAAYFREVFPSSEGELPAGWRWSKLGDIANEDKRTLQGNSNEAHRLPYLSLEHVESGTGQILISPIGSPDQSVKSNTFYFDDSHILYGKLRPYLNKVAKPEFIGRCTAELIPLKPTLAIRDYLWWLLKRPETMFYAMKGKTGSRMPRADMKALMGMPIPLPPLEEQRRIARVLNKQMVAVEEAKKAARQQIDTIYALPATLLRKAFSGEI